MRPLPSLLPVLLAACGGGVGTIDLATGDEPVGPVRSASWVSSTSGGRNVESLVLSTVDDWCGAAAEALPALRTAGVGWSLATSDPEADADALCAANTAYLDALRPFADRWYAPGATTATTTVLGALAEGTIDVDDDATPFQTSILRYGDDPFAAAEAADCGDPQAVFTAFTTAVDTWTIATGTLTVEALDADVARYRIEGTLDDGGAVTLQGRAERCDLDPALLGGGS